MDNGRLKAVLFVKNIKKHITIELRKGLTESRNYLGKGQEACWILCYENATRPAHTSLFSQWSLRRHVLPKCPSSLGCRRGQNTIWYVSKELPSGFVILNASGFRISLLSGLISRLYNTVFKHCSKSVQLRRKQGTGREIIMFIGRC